MSIYEKISKVQDELKVPKNQYNDFGGYYYRSCEDIIQAAKPLLHANNLTMTISDELELIGDRYYIKATVTIFDIENEEKHQTNGYAREAEKKKGMDPSQITGSASSYARKYALNGIFALDDTKDADATNIHKQDKPQNRNNEKSKLNCDDCEASISKGNAKYCQKNKKKFDGKILCFECQKKYKG